MKYLIFQASLGWDPTKCLSEKTKAKLTNAGFNIQDINQDELCLEEAMQTCCDQISYITLNSIEDLPALYKAVGRCIFNMNSIMICDDYIDV